MRIAKRMKKAMAVMLAGVLAVAGFDGGIHTMAANGDNNVIAYWKGEVTLTSGTDVNGEFDLARDAGYTTEEGSSLGLLKRDAWYGTKKDQVNLEYNGENIEKNPVAAFEGKTITVRAAVTEQGAPKLGVIGKKGSLSNAWAGEVCTNGGEYITEGTAGDILTVSGEIPADAVLILTAVNCKVTDVVISDGVYTFPAVGGETANPPAVSTQSPSGLTDKNLIWQGTLYAYQEGTEKNAVYQSETLSENLSAAAEVKDWGVWAGGIKKVYARSCFALTVDLSAYDKAQLVVEGTTTASADTFELTTELDENDQAPWWSHARPVSAGTLAESQVTGQYAFRQVMDLETKEDAFVAVVPNSTDRMVIEKITVELIAPEPTPSPTLEPTPSPTQEPTPSPTQEPTPSPTQKPTPSPTQEPTPSPTQEPTPSPTQESTPSPTQESTPTPTMELTPTPTMEPTPNPDKELLSPELEVESVKKVFRKKPFALDVETESDGTLHYSSSNKKVAVISDDGMVHMKGCGTTKITVRQDATDKYKSAVKTATLTVVPPRVSMLKIICITKNRVIKLKWTKTPHVTGYEISVSTNPQFTDPVWTHKWKGKTVVNTKMPMKQVGKKYYIRVRAYAKSGGRTVYGKWSKVRSERPV